MLIAGENRLFFFSVENIAFFQGFGIFTFPLSFKAAKALNVWGIIPGPDSVYRYLGDGEKWKHFLNQSLFTQPVQSECSWICSVLILLPNVSIIRLWADWDLQPHMRQREGRRKRRERGRDGEGKQERDKRDTWIETHRQMEWRHTWCQMPQNAKRTLLCNH